MASSALAAVGLARRFAGCSWGKHDTLWLISRNNPIVAALVLAIQGPG